MFFPLWEWFFFKVSVRQTKYAYSPRTSSQLPVRKPRLKVAAVVETDQESRQNPLRACIWKGFLNGEMESTAPSLPLPLGLRLLTILSLQINQIPEKEQGIFFLTFKHVQDSLNRKTSWHLLNHSEHFSFSILFSLFCFPLEHSALETLHVISHSSH